MSYFRHPRTAAERRANAALVIDEDALIYNVRPRASRNGHNLVSEYDDIRHGRRGGSKKNRRRIVEIEGYVPPPAAAPPAEEKSPVPWTGPKKMYDWGLFWERFCIELVKHYAKKVA
jgi:hypothetical protein